MIYMIDYIGYVALPKNFSEEQNLTVFNGRGVIVTSVHEDVEKTKFESLTKILDEDNKYMSSSINKENLIEFIAQNKRILNKLKKHLSLS